MPFFLRGLALGFLIAAPVGPIGVLCIRRSLAGGWRLGFATGLGAATADAFYGAVAGFGLTAISFFLVRQWLWLQGLGCVFLCYLGVRTFRARPGAARGESPAAESVGWIAAYGTTVFLTLTNPMTILSFAGVFAGMGLARTGGNYHGAAMLVAGVLLGSAAWWLVLSGLAAAFRERVGAGAMRWINRVSGAVILAFGAWSLLQVARHGRS